ncbi:MAG: Na+/H+ antiporter NhaC family protein [Rectinema sp.]|nr:Na+/H+ antiporter NhaC family protein [Rectinema sp.]
MENFGILALLPPILTVALAILTKDVIISLFLGIFAGAMTVAGGNPLQALVRLTDLLAEMLADGWNIRIILFCALLGALVGMWHKTGAAYAFGSWAGKKAKSKVSVLLFTWIFGIIIFIDDYFNSLTIGACMRPVCDEKKISRAKLAYILDSTAAPVCIIAPISSWVITVMSYTKGSEGFDKLGISEFTYFIRTIPNNLYALFAILMVAFVALKGRDFGPMARSEARAEKGLGLYDEKRYGLVAGKLDEKAATTNVKWFDFFIPLVLLIACAVVFFPVTTWMGSIDGEKIKTMSEAMASMSLGEAFNNTDASKALFYAIMFTIVFSYLYFIARRLLNISQSAESIIEGIKSMVPAIVILSMAWSIGFIIKKSPEDGGVGLANYLAQVVTSGNFPLWLLPLIVFLISCVISFSTGTSWGTMAIMIPIAMPIAIALGEKMGLQGDALINVTIFSTASVMGGAVFGDHCSPISDTTILSSTGANCPHLEHVATQMPYAVFIAICTAFGVLAIGISSSTIIGLAVTAVLFLFGIAVLPKLWGVEKQALE